MPDLPAKAGQHLSAHSGHGPDPSALCAFLMVNTWLEREVHRAEQAVALTPR